SCGHLSQRGESNAVLADEVELHQAVKAHDDCLQLQRCIDVVNRWSNKWALPQFPNVIEGTPIRKVEHQRDLGFIVTKNLSSDAHGELTASKANSVVYRLFKNSFTRKLIIRMLGFLYEGIPSSMERNRNFKLHPLAFRRRTDLVLFHKILQGKCGLDANKFCGLRPSVFKDMVERYLVP
ncbi:hypothetical protein COOONC_00923, partial [Cooperia oncophora]